MATIRFQGSRADVTRVVQQLAAMLTGRAQDNDQIARGFMLALGFAALSDIRAAYIEKARGGTDAMGIKWQPLAPETIANRRVGPGAKKARISVSDTAGQRLDKITQAQLVRDRERIRNRETKKAFRRFQLSLPRAEALRRARIVGGLKATADTGKTKVQTLGNRDVEILRDTGILFNSLSPGLLQGARYQKPTDQGGEQQIMETFPGELIVGTNVPYATTHQRGDPSRNVPARPFLPGDNYPVPQIWWDRWLRAANAALVSSIQILFRRGT